MVATDVVIPQGIFNFAGQAKVDTFVIDLTSLLSEQRAYDAAMVNKYRLSLEAIRTVCERVLFLAAPKEHRPAAGARTRPADRVPRPAALRRYFPRNGRLADDAGRVLRTKRQFLTTRCFAKRTQANDGFFSGKGSSPSFLRACLDGRSSPRPTLPASAAGSARGVRPIMLSRRWRTGSRYMR